MNILPRVWHFMVKNVRSSIINTCFFIILNLAYLSYLWYDVIVWRLDMARIKTNKYPNTQSYCIIEDYKRNGKRTTRVVENIGNYQKVSMLAKDQGIDVDTWLDNYLNDYRKRNGLILDDEKVIIEKYSNRIIPKNEINKFNVGYLFLKDIYYSLKLDKIIKYITENINLNLI